MTNADWAPPDFAMNKPSIARVYDFMLGGKDNFAIDRQTGELALHITPDAKEAARANRAFLRRVIQFLTARAGVRQFLDIGSGLPSQGNVHEIAQAIDPAARVVYVDIDAMVLAHARALLGGAENTTVIQGDLRQPAAILEHPQLRALVDFDQPVGLLLFAIMHHLKDGEGPGRIATELREALPSGSYIAISHFHNPGPAHPEASRKATVVEKIFNETLGTGRWRTHEEILGYFGDFEVLEPGLVPLAEWRPDPGETLEQPNTYDTFVGGLARKS